jgi:hypothetical protein
MKGLWFWDSFLVSKLIHLTMWGRLTRGTINLRERTNASSTWMLILGHFIGQLLHPSPMVQLDEALQGTQKDLPVHKTVLAVNERDCGVAVAVVELEVTPPKWIDPDIW